MDQENNYTPPGICRAERDFLRDYHRRAGCIGVFQFTFASFYLYFAICEICWNSTRPESYWTTAELYELWFWLTLRDLAALLHFYSSVLLIKVSIGSPENKLEAIKYCSWIKLMNQLFFLYEILVLVIIFQYWRFGVCFILYRLLFHHEVSGLLDTVRILAPPPPGHYC